MDFIQGEDRTQAILFPDSIDDYIEENSSARVIDAFVNSLDLSALGFSRHEPAETGRPAYNPKDLLKLYVYGKELAAIDGSKFKAVNSKDRNIAVCPMGKTLYPQFYKKSKGEAVFCNPAACKQCACRCTKEARAFRYQFVMKKPEFSKDCNDEGLAVKQVHVKPRKEIVAQRKCIVEHPFGTIKRNMDAGYCLLKGKVKVTAEFSLIFLAYNLKRVINILGSKKLTDYISNSALPA